MGSIADRSKGQVLAYVAAAILIAVAGFRYLGGDDEAQPAPVSIEESSASADGNPTGEEGGRLYVHVAGAVRRAGLYRLAAGTRVGAAIDRAGGIRAGADLSAVNLAAELQDGQQVVVPRRGATPVAAAPGSLPTASSVASAGGAPTAPVSLAQATPEELDATVDGIGPVLASRIVEFRDERGSVGSIDELREVDGIGEARLEALRDALIP